MARILLVDDEEAVRNAVARRLKRSGYEITQKPSRADGIAEINSVEAPYDVVVTDMVMETPDSGLEVLKAALTRDVFTEVIVLTAYGNVANAVECMRRGAFDYVEKNVPGVDVFELLDAKVKQAMERRQSSVSGIRRIERYM